MVPASALAHLPPAVPSPNGKHDLRPPASRSATRSRLEIIRYLRLMGPSNRTRIVQDTAISHGLVGQALNKLKSLDLVTDNSNDVDLPARERTYTLRTARTDHLLHTMARFLLVPDLDH